MPNVVPPDGAARHELVILAASADGIEAIGKSSRATIANGAIDYALPLEQIGPMLVRLTSAAPNEGNSGKEAV